MSHLIDMTGQRFGRLTVIERTEGPNTRNAYWRCRCDCGNEKVVTGSGLRRGDSKSCGCLAKARSGGMKLQYIKNDPNWKKDKSYKGEQCPYNEGCSCLKKDCWQCGWNPEVAKDRTEKYMEEHYGKSESDACQD